VLLSPFGPSAVPPGPDHRAPTRPPDGAGRVRGPAQVSGSFLCPGGCVITTDKRVRVNRQIRISPVRVIASDGEQLGIMPIEEALTTAENEGWTSSRWRRRHARRWSGSWTTASSSTRKRGRSRQARKKQHQILIKEVKFRPGIEPHDFDFKIRHARRFLEEGNKVKVTMMFRGRQIANPERVAR
jgi:translation initiation factor IF-3